MIMNTGDPYRCCTEQQLVDIRKRSSIGSAGESELLIVPLIFQRQHNFERGKGQYLHHVSEAVKKRRLRKRYKLQMISGTSEETMPEGQVNRKPLEEDDWKAGFGKTDCPV